jgi:hypothetical protein
MNKRNVNGGGRNMSVSGRTSETEKLMGHKHLLILMLNQRF